MTAILAALVVWVAVFALVILGLALICGPTPRRGFGDIEGWRSGDPRHKGPDSGQGQGQR